ncbi:MAG: RES family NAD+ phosphorylase [Mycobacterium sp.]|uniref:RES family NAD+ phosphorylase n=1 Tax=Mycobacterium sp. TaxID=1785 RepID=UPI003F9DA598
MDAPLYRAHTVNKSPWWFSSDLSGRFDLIQPNGTCYLATDMATALRERFGHDLVRQGVVTFEAAARTQVSELRVPVPRWLAHTCARNAVEFGMTREIGTCPAYDIPQAWASAFFGTGKHAGIRYQTRFTTGSAPNAVALFDEARQRSWSTDPHALGGVQACAQAGIKVAHPPTRRQVWLVQPPD